MLSKIYCSGIIGTEGYIVTCETDLSDGLPGVNMIGQLSLEVKEAQDRVKTAIRNTGIHLAPAKITINLSPADIKKSGCGYDLAIAVSILVSSGVIYGEYSERVIQESVFIGELSLDGQVNKTNGVLSMAMAAKRAGFRRVFVPVSNSREGGAVEGIDCYGIESLMELVDILNSMRELPEKALYSSHNESEICERDFSDICGQETVKRATVIGVAGRHNILYIGPAGTGKSMIASRIPTIMPDMTKEEQLEISKIYSINGLLSDENPLIYSRPFRSPHHTISMQALCGGGTVPKPGEISLASGGVLFLDELAEFKGSTLEGLRQPMEERKVVVSRVRSSIEYPADFVLVAATNPCKCGFYPDRSRCSCSDSMVKNYLGKISKPILDRIDICVEMPNPAYKDLKAASSGQSSSQIREEIERVREKQTVRLRDFGLHFNSEMSPKLIKEFCRLKQEDDDFLKMVYIKKGMSARGLNKILKVARTISDFDDQKDINRNSLCEAIYYRSIEEKYWTGGYDDAGYKFTKIKS
ncbi:MAG: YifB family Mg chelatase-like AAA ATPase [Lachnospiraceae bacterium]|nr:YifB family Mg chelatase-like AAA ATPase [Lachnospiraceae bacterium]